MTIPCLELRRAALLASTIVAMLGSSCSKDESKIYPDPPSPVADIPTAANIAELRQNLAIIAKQESRSMHRLLWRAGHLVRTAVESKNLSEILESFKAQGIQLRGGKPKYDNYYVFLAWEKAYQTHAGLEHDLEVHIYIRFDTRTAGLRMRGVYPREKLIEELYPRGSLGHAYLIAAPEFETRWRELPQVSTMDFRWLFSCPSTNGFPKDFPLPGGIQVFGHMVKAVEHMDGKSGEVERYYEGMGLRLEAMSYLDPSRVHGKNVEPSFQPQDRFDAFMPGRFSGFGVVYDLDEVDPDYKLRKGR